MFPLPPSLRPARPGSLSVRLAGLATGVLLVLAACAPGGSDGPLTGRDDGSPPDGADSFAAPPVALLFTDYDANHDRRVTADEFERGVQTSFAAADTDANGRISPLEFVAWARKVLGTEYGTPNHFAFTPDPASAITRAAFHATLRREFDKLDSNKDGVLTRDELVIRSQQSPGDQPGSRPEGAPPRSGDRPPPQ